MTIKPCSIPADAPAGEILAEISRVPLEALIALSEAATLESFGPLVTYSRKVFIPLTELCRDVCHYCTFAKTPRRLENAYMTRDAVLEVARAGHAAGCREALFTLGDRPEARFAVARTALAALGHDSTLNYLCEVAQLVLEETGLLPHLNPGIMGATDYAALRPVAASMGLMLESTSGRLCQRGGPHHGSPDKLPATRLAAIRAAGKAGVAFTTGLLIGIGETRRDRIDALVAIRDLHARYGHIQEVIIQNFQPKPGTRMADYPASPLEDQLWTIAAARLVLSPDVTIQAPPNLRDLASLPDLLRAGVNDWGGVSPVTTDHVNPEAPWPHLEDLERVTAASGRNLRQRLAIGPRHALRVDRWLDPGLAPVVRRSVDARGLPLDGAWRAGGEAAFALPSYLRTPKVSSSIRAIVQKAEAGDELDEGAICQLFGAEAADFEYVCHRADAVRRDEVGDVVTYVVNRNINYTNICLYRCSFCAFSKGSSRKARGPAYLLDREVIARRVAEAVERDATEVCLQGGIHPDFDGNTYLEILRAVRSASPDIHIHAFSPLEVSHGARTLGMDLHRYLSRLRDAGLASLPGTAAEILDDEVRAVICPDKVTTSEWLGVMRAAHEVGLRSTATIMFGHVEGYQHWARHLLHIRALQRKTGGFCEFVPLPFVHMEAPMAMRGQSRSGPSAREAILMHAVARLALHPYITSVQASWVKLGDTGVVAALQSGANDLGGTLMDESITRAAGGVNGQLHDVAHMQRIAQQAGRSACQRTTLYQDPRWSRPGSNTTREKEIVDG